MQMFALKLKGPKSCKRGRRFWTFVVSSDVKKQNKGSLLPLKSLQAVTLFTICGAAPGFVSKLQPEQCLLSSVCWDQTHKHRDLSELMNYVFFVSRKTLESRALQHIPNLNKRKRQTAQSCAACSCLFIICLLCLIFWQNTPWNRSCLPLTFWTSFGAEHTKHKSKMWIITLKTQFLIICPQSNSLY